MRLWYNLSEIFFGSPQPFPRFKDAPRNFHSFFTFKPLFCVGDIHSCVTCVSICEWVYSPGYVCGNWSWPMLNDFPLTAVFQRHFCYCDETFCHKITEGRNGFIWPTISKVTVHPVMENKVDCPETVMSHLFWPRAEYVVSMCQLLSHRITIFWIQKIK